MYLVVLVSSSKCIFLFFFSAFRQLCKTSDWFGSVLSGGQYNPIVIVRHIIYKYSAHSLGVSLFPTRVFAPLR